jgi:hypothetical protein
VDVVDVVEEPVVEVDFVDVVDVVEVAGAVTVIVLAVGGSSPQAETARQTPTASTARTHLNKGASTAARLGFVPSGLRLTPGATGADRSTDSR